MNIDEVLYAPKGGMCANCTKRDDDCSKLDFGNMYVIDFYNDGKEAYVRCSSYINRQTGK